METPLTPLEFARRARRLYPEREAVVDGDLRLTYSQFFERCDRWSSALAGARRQPGRPRRLHRAEHPCPARIVLRGAADRRRPRADQLPADRRRLRLHHQPQRRPKSSARTRDYLEAVDSIRDAVAERRARSSRSKARERAGSTTRRCWLARRGQLRCGPRSPRATCSRSTTPAARPRAPRA